MGEHHIIVQGHGDWEAEKNSRKIWYAVLGTMLVIIGFYGGVGAFQNNDFKILLFCIFIFFLGIFLVWLWFRVQFFYLRYFRRRNRAPIHRISYG